MKKIYLMLFSIILASTSFGQNPTSTNEILGSLFELDRAYLNKNLESSRYLLVKHNMISYIDYYPTKNNFQNQIHFENFMYLPDSVFTIFSDSITDNELVLFFNNEQNYKTLLASDLEINLSKGLNTFEALHFDVTKGKISSAHIWTYQFYNKYMFSQYGFGWTPGQPQTGYIYNLAINVPKEIMREVKKINPNKYLEINTDKSIIYDNQLVKTKMYFLKGDIVELLETNSNWLLVRYYGKKTIEGWIKKSDVE